MIRRLKVVIALLLLIVGMPLSVWAEGNEQNLPRPTIRLGSVSLAPEVAERHSGEIVLVSFNIKVSQEGILEDAKIVTSSGDEVIDNAVIDGVKRGVYNPVYTNGKAEGYSKTLTLKFNFETEQDKNKRQSSN
jgi:TonB family protein